MSFIPLDALSLSFNMCFKRPSRFPEAFNSISCQVNLTLTNIALLIRKTLIGVSNLFLPKWISCNGALTSLAPASPGLPHQKTDLFHMCLSPCLNRLSSGTINLFSTFVNPKRKSMTASAPSHSFPPLKF